jgi:hypothetical protein
MKTKMSMEELERSFLRFDDLENLTPTTNIQNVESALVSSIRVHFGENELAFVPGINITNLRAML